MGMECRTAPTLVSLAKVAQPGDGSVSTEGLAYGYFSALRLSTWRFVYKFASLCVRLVADQRASNASERQSCPSVQTGEMRRYWGMAKYVLRGADQLRADVNRPGRLYEKLFRLRTPRFGLRRMLGSICQRSRAKRHRLGFKRGLAPPQGRVTSNHAVPR